jgi:hypothetical protein
MKAKVVAAGMEHEQAVAESARLQPQLASAPSPDKSSSEHMYCTSSAVAHADTTWTIGSRQNTS